MSATEDAVDETEAELWDDAGYVVSSTYRREVLDRLRERPATPTTIAEDTGLEVTHVSRAMRGLRGRDAVELLVPEERRKGRIYDITADGEAIAERVDELQTGGNR